MKLTLTVVMAIFVIAVLLAMKPFTIVDSGETGVVLRVGAVDRTLPEGFHMLNPFLEDVVTFETRTQLVEVTAAAASKDLQDVTATLAINFRLDPTQVGAIYSNLKTEYRERLINPVIQDEVKSATAQFTAEELITKRGEVKATILDALKSRLTDDGINVTQVSITNFTFSQSFTNAIEAKVTASELAVKAENDLERVKFEQQQEIEKFKAQAEQTRLQNEALKTGSQFIELKRLEVDMKIAEKWNGVLPTNFVPGSALPLLNITQ